MNKKLVTLAILNAGCYNTSEINHLAEVDIERNLVHEFFELSKPLSNPLQIGNNSSTLCKITHEVLRPTEDHSSAVIWDYSRRFENDRKSAKFYTEQSGIPIHFLLKNYNSNEENPCIEKYIDGDVILGEYNIIKEQRPDGIPDYILLTPNCAKKYGINNTMELVGLNNGHFGGYVKRINLSDETSKFFENVFSDHIHTEIEYLKELGFD